jgi:ABC-type uncharacterized transport system permease subunit
MDANAISIFACFTYIVALALQCVHLLGRFSIAKSWHILIIFCGVSLHGFSLYRWIDTPLGQNLSLSHMFSMVCWVMVLVSVFLSFFRSLLNLRLFILPLASLSIVLALFFPGQDIFLTRNHPNSAIHILISIAAFGLLGMAALQAAVLYVQNRLLRNKSALGIVGFLPPLQTTETLLFSIVWFGFFFLSASLTSAFLLLEDFSPFRLQHKIILSVLAWIAFALLLYNHHQSGLRGQRAILWTLIGVGLLIVSYVGGKLTPKEFLN